MKYFKIWKKKDFIGVGIWSKHITQSKFIIDTLSKFDINTWYRGNVTSCYYGLHLSEKRIRISASKDHTFFKKFITFDEFIDLINQPINQLDNSLINNFEIY